MKQLLCATTAVALLASMASLAIGHEDDPKLQDREPAVRGAIWQYDNDPPPTRGFSSDGEITLMTWIPLNNFMGNPNSGSDCWGYTSPSGREYAIFGHEAGTAIVEITNPGAAEIVAEIDGPNSLWRDIKVFGTRAYAVSEGGEGIQVINLSNIDAGVATLENTVTSGGTAASHNVVINEDSGYLYRCGGGSNGLRFYDLNANPGAPAYIGSWSTKYVHDAQVVTYPAGTPWAGREIAFLCAGYNNGWNETGLTILDVTDKNDIVVLGELQYANNHYSHQGWLSEDLQYFYLNDELDEQNTGSLTTTRIIDVSNLNSPFQAGTCTSGSTSIDHNLYIKGNTMYQANYRSGVRIFDITNRVNPTQTAWFDTYPSDDGASFNGLWSVYPYFDSGTLIGSDLERGLFVWSLEPPALVVNLVTAIPDQLVPAGGDSFDMQVTFADGVGLDSVQSRLIWTDSDGTHGAPLAVIDGNDPMLLRAEFGPSVCGDMVDFHAVVVADTGDSRTAGSGEALSADAVDLSLDIDFESTAGWTTSGNATDGQWDFGVPVNCHRGDPAQDYDFSGQCALTDNSSAGSCNSDVDGGSTVLTSPIIDASTGGVLSYARWLDNSYGASPGEDSMYVAISDDNGGSWSELEQVGPTGPGTTGGWFEVQFDLNTIAGYTPSATTRLRFTVEDTGDGSVVEGGIDAIRIFSVQCDDTTCPGDLNGDSIVNIEDILVAIAGFGTDYTVEDILEVLAAFGTAC
jgi:choice-of-anchor B domain-containing protein